MIQFQSTLFCTHAARAYAVAESWLTAGGANSADDVSQALAQMTDAQLADEVISGLGLPTEAGAVDADGQPIHADRIYSRDDLIAAFAKFRETRPDRKERWFAFNAYNAMTLYGFGTTEEADDYADLLNADREINIYAARPLTESEVAELKLEDNTEAVNLADELAARAEEIAPEYDADDLVLCRSDRGDGGWSLHAPGSTDEAIASGDAHALASGEAEEDPDTGEWSRPNDADYRAALGAMAAEKSRLEIGARVEGGEGDDRDTGTVSAPPQAETRHPMGRDSAVWVRWDSGVSSWAPVSELSRIS